MGERGDTQGEGILKLHVYPKEAMDVNFWSIPKVPGVFRMEWIEKKAGETHKEFERRYSGIAFKYKRMGPYACTQLTVLDLLNQLAKKKPYQKNWIFNGISNNCIGFVNTVLHVLQARDKSGEQKQIGKGREFFTVVRNLII